MSVALKCLVLCLSALIWINRAARARRREHWRTGGRLPRRPGWHIPHVGPSWHEIVHPPVTLASRGRVAAAGQIGARDLAIQAMTCERPVVRVVLSMARQEPGGAGRACIGR